MGGIKVWSTERGNVLFDDVEERRESCRKEYSPITVITFDDETALPEVCESTSSSISLKTIGSHSLKVAVGVGAILPIILLSGWLSFGVQGVMLLSVLIGILIRNSKAKKAKALDGEISTDPEFPYADRFLFTDRWTQQYLTEICKYTGESYIISSLIRKKIEISKDRNEFEEWVSYVNTIFRLDKTLPHDAIPLMNDKLIEIFKMVQKKSDDQKAADEKTAEEEADNEAKIKNARLDVELDFARQDSEKAVRYAIEHIQSV